MANTVSNTVSVTPSNVISANVHKVAGPLVAANGAINATAVKHDVTHLINHEVNFVVNSVVTEVNGLIGQIQGLLSNLPGMASKAAVKPVVTSNTVTSNSVANTK